MLVLPCVQNEEPVVRNTAFLCLGSSSLLDVNQAQKYFHLLLQVCVCVCVCACVRVCVCVTYVCVDVSVNSKIFTYMIFTYMCIVIPGEPDRS